MKRFQAMKFVNVPVVVDVICNKCGNTCRPHAHAMNFEHANVSVSWGYESNKDCEHHHWDVCEPCYDEIVAAFKLPPTKLDYMSGERAGTYEEHGHLHRIPAYPRMSPARANDEEFLDFREGVEKAAHERGFQEGARVMRGFSSSDLDLMFRAVREFSCGSLRDGIPPDQHDAWVALDDKLNSMTTAAVSRPGEKERPNE